MAIGIVMAVLPLTIQRADAAVSAMAASDTDTWAPFPVYDDTYNDNNGVDFSVNGGGVDGPCPLVANFKVFADPYTFSNQTLEITTQAYGFPSCWPSDSSAASHLKLELEFFDWTAVENGRSPWSIWTLNVEPGFNAYFPNQLSAYLYKRIGLTLVKMWIWSSTPDYSAHEQATIPFDTRMCDPSTALPGMPTQDCGTQPNITINTNTYAALPPPLPATAAATDIVSVGEGTIGPFDQALSAAYNASSPAPASKYYSIDATGASPLFPKTGGGVMARPDGSEAGRLALDNNTHEMVDAARSSVAPDSATDKTYDYFIRFADDAVGWSAPTGGNAPQNLTTADLKGIYDCGITQWNQITDIPGYSGPGSTIKAYLPPSGTGTRENFLAAIGVPSSSPGLCVQPATPEADEGTDPVFQNNPDAIIPYSIGHYAGQTTYGHSSGNDAPGVLDANRSINGIPQIDSTGNLNATLVNTTSYGYSLYHVVRPADWQDPALGPPLAALFGRARQNGWLCANGTSLIQNYGFLPLPTNVCGTIING